MQNREIKLNSKIYFFVFQRFQYLDHFIPRSNMVWGWNIKILKWEKEKSKEWIALKVKCVQIRNGNENMS